jgi:hypothetical protein
VPHPLRLPPRESLKLALTAMEALEGLGAAEPARHLALVRAWDGVPAARPAHALRGAGPRRGRGVRRGVRLRPRLAPGHGARGRRPLQPPGRAGVLRRRRRPGRTGPRAFVADYAFDIRPATDDRPYFLDFFRWRALPALWEAARGGNAGLLDWGWPLQLATLGVAAVFGMALILLPARVLARQAEAGLRRATAAYFLLVGAGFMFTEIAAMQRLVLLFGHPVYAFAATLAAFLVFAGLGSGAAARLDAARSDGGGARWWTGRLDLVVLAIAGLATLTPWPGRGCFHRPVPG